MMTERQKDSSGAGSGTTIAESLVLVMCSTFRKQQHTEQQQQLRHSASNQTISETNSPAKRYGESLNSAMIFFILQKAKSRSSERA